MFGQCWSTDTHISVEMCESGKQCTYLVSVGVCECVYLVSVGVRVCVHIWSVLECVNVHI